MADGEDATVLAAVIAKNPTAKSKVKISTNDKTGEAVVAAVDAKEYTGTVNVTYTVKPAEGGDNRSITEVVESFDPNSTI